MIIHAQFIHVFYFKSLAKGSTLNPCMHARFVVSIHKIYKNSPFTWIFARAKVSI